MKTDIISRWDYRKIFDVVLIIYLVLVTFYGKTFIPIHSKFLMRYPLIFPLLLILILKTVPSVLKIASQRREKKNGKDTSSFFQSEKFNALTKKHYLTAILIFLAVFCVKSYIAKGITAHVVHVDEEIVVNDLLKMISTRTLDYERYNYPPVFYYTNYVLFNMYYHISLKSEYGGIGDVPRHHWYDFGRQINAAYGALFVAGVFILCYQIFGLMYGLLASFAAFISPLRLNVDSLFRIQPASDFYIILAFIILISLLREPKTYKYAVLAVLTSLAVCSFFIRIVILLPVGLFLIFHLLRERRWTKELTIFTISILLTTLILLIPALMNLDKFNEKLKYERLYFDRFSKYETVLDNTNSYKAMTFWMQKDGIGYGIFILAGVGIVIGLMKRSQWALFVYSMMAAHYLFIGSYFTTFNRYTAFFLPFLILFAFLVLDSGLALNRKKRWVGGKTAYLMFALIIVACLIPFIFNFTDILKDTVRPHNLDLFLKWRDQNYKDSIPTLSAVKSMKIKDSSVVIIPDRYLIKPDWDGLASYISKRYKIMLLSDPGIEKYFRDWKTWKRVKSFDEKTGKGGCFYVLENSVPVEKLKSDPRLTDDSIPERWKKF